MLLEEKYGAGIHDVMVAPVSLRRSSRCKLAFNLPGPAYFPEWGLGERREAIPLLVLKLSITASVVSCPSAELHDAESLAIATKRDTDKATFSEETNVPKDLLKPRVGCLDRPPGSFLAHCHPGGSQCPFPRKQGRKGKETGGDHTYHKACKTLWHVEPMPEDQHDHA